MSKPHSDDMMVLHSSKEAALNQTSTIRSKQAKTKKKAVTTESIQLQDSRFVGLHHKRQEHIPNILRSTVDAKAQVNRHSNNITHL